MNEILRDIPPRRGVLPIPGPARGSPRVDEMSPRQESAGRRSRRQATPIESSSAALEKMESGTAAAPTRDGGKDGSTMRLA